MAEFLYLVKTFLFLFAVIDPIGSVPVFLEATKNFDYATKKKVAVKACIIAFFILLFFIVAGQLIMEAMHITLPAFQIAGGLVLFLFALTMIFGEGKPEEEKHMIKDYTHVTVFPIAMPSIASPGAILSVVLLTDNYTYTIPQQALTSLIVLLVMAATCLLLLAARKVQDKVGETGILVVSKIMGLILASFAVQNILSGITEYFNLAN
jgi:multiple antibiotic resistance protein